MFFVLKFADSLAEVVPALNAFISLLGALCSSALALVFPVIIELVLNWNSPDGPSKLNLSKNAIILAVALFGLVTGTYESFTNLIIAFRKK